ncbi:MAG: CvpA family protein [Rhodoferax sp.]
MPIQMQTLDWVCVAIFALSMVVGLWRGLVMEVLSVASWFAAFVLAQWFAPLVAHWLPMQGASEVVRYAAAFVLVFIATLLLGALLAVLVRKLVTVVGLRPIDRLLGALFGALRAAIVVLALAVVAGMTPMRSAPWWQESVGAQWATKALRSLRPLLPQEFGKYLP